MVIFARSIAPVLLAAAAFAGTAACTLDKEPLHAGWLASGVYPYPSPFKCTPPTRPGQPFDVLAQSPLPPSLGADVGVHGSLPWLGAFSVTGYGAGSVGPRASVSTRASQPMRIADERVMGAQLPGFAAGVDLRTYRRIAFITDTSGFMCEYAHCPGSSVDTGNLPAPLLQRMGDQVDAAVAGLRPDQSFVVAAGSAWREITFVPFTQAGRALAGNFVRGQVCSGARGVRGQLLRVLTYAPDVIVLFTDGGIQRHRHDDYEAHYEACNIQPSYLYCYVDDVTENLTLASFADGMRLPPIITVTVQRHDARWLRSLAEATGGAYVDVAP